jgi:asparagine N-glycosylation enzyme membrane subunit Stt3
MKIKISKNILLLILIFLLTFAFRLYFVYQVEGFSSNAYFHIREVESISDKGSLTRFDELSYGGREILYPPIFHYFLAFFDLFFPLNFVLKVIPELLISFLVIIVYKIAKEMTKDENSALLAALISGFVPLFIGNTLNQVSVYSLTIFIKQ